MSARIALVLATLTLHLVPAGAAAQVPAAIPASAPIGPTISEIAGSTDTREGMGIGFGVAVYNPTGEELTFTWDMGDGTSGAQGNRRALTHRYLSDGDFVVKVSVSGSAGFSADRSLAVTVRNGPPVIEGLESSADIQPGEPVEFEAAATDPGDDELTYTWDFGDGSPPVSGTDLTEPSHTYDEGGEYVVTLTVSDGNGGEVVRELTVVPNPGFVGLVAGEVPAFTFSGTSGPASLSSGLGGVNLFSGAAPMGGGVADMSGMFGVCLVNAGFWDDNMRAHINFVLTLPADSAFAPNMYILGWEASETGIAPGSLLINALVMWIDPIYEKTKEGASNTQIATGGGVMDMILRGFAGGFEEEQLGPGRNWTLAASAGLVRITRVTPEKIEGHLQAYFQGAWQEANASGTVTYAQIEGDFAYRLDEVARANLLRCADRPFTIESHKPVVEETVVDFTDPGVRIAFSGPIRPSSVNASTIQVGYLTGASSFNPVDGVLSVEPDGRTVVFTPDERLLDAVFYHVRVSGGESGVTGASGDPLPEDYEWRFATVVDLLEREGGGGG